MFWQSRSGGDDDRIFLIDSGERYTYADVFRKGDLLFSDADRSVVMILCDRSCAFVAAYLGALRRGLVPMLVDGAATAQAVASNIATYRPRYIFAPETAELAGYVLHKRAGPKALFLREAQDAAPLHEGLALLMPTSGSTGDPKCVRLTARNLESCTRSITEYLQMSAQRVCVSLLPFHYSYGLSVLHNTIFCRASMVLTEKTILDKTLWSMIEDEKVTDLAGVPFTFETMRRLRLSEACMDNLVCVTQAGGRLSPELTRHFHEYFHAHGVEYFSMYGQTEAAPRISYVPPARAMEKLGSVGIPISCGRVVIAETGEAAGEGELVYIGSNVSMGYAFGADDLGRGDEFQGVLRTGDQASIDTEGFITIVGRKKRFIKLQGVSVNLDHAEAVLKSRTLDCMVIGVENRLLVCVTEPDVERARISVAEMFNFHPSSVKVVACEALPFTAAGKPDYPALSARFLST